MLVDGGATRLTGARDDRGRERVRRVASTARARGASALDIFHVCRIEGPPYHHPTARARDHRLRVDGDLRYNKKKKSVSSRFERSYHISAARRRSGHTCP